jgi:N,N'-diacetylchitobiose transport system permease protein
MTREDKKTLPVWLAGYLDVNRGVDWGAIMAGSTLIAVPVIVFFLIVQRKIAFGLTAGSVKG